MPKGVPTTRGADGKRLVHWLGHILGLTAALFSLGASAQLSVSESGSPIYSHPIAVPPGIGNLVPNIGLLYAAGGVNGPVGHGWSIQGMSAITRCAGIRAIDGSPRAVDFSGNDKLCLDGQRLIQTDANGAPSAFPQLNDSLGGSGLVREYRTEKDSGARIRAYGSAAGVAANGAAYFKVWTKGGQIYEYGDNANTTAKAAITVQGDGVVSVWAVSRISDTLGNYIDFQYEQREVPWGSGPTANSPTPGKEWNLLEIRYTGTSTAQPRNRVQFVYSDRTVAPANTVQDRAETYHQGKKNVSVRRLDAVKTYTNWAGDEAPYGASEATPYPAVPAAGAIKVRAVKLAYEQGPVTNRSRVKTITECVGAAEAQCLPPVTFNYAAGGSDAYTSSTAFGASGMATATLASSNGSYAIIPIDFDGDGKTDILRWSTNPAENVLYKSIGNGGFTQVRNGTAAGQFNITDQQLFGAAGCFFSIVADFNGDGLPDILRYSALTPDNSNVPCPNAGSNYLYLSNGDGAFSRSVISGVFLSRLRSREITDCLYRFQPNGYCMEPGDKSGWTAGRNFYLLDVDGDGKLDVVTSFLPYVAAALTPTDPCVGSTTCTQVFKGDGVGNFTQIPSNMGDKATFVQPGSLYTLGEPGVAVDLNGDGLRDLARVGNPWLGTSAAWRSRGDGNFDPYPIGSNCAVPIDFNGDGRADCVYASTWASGLLVSDGLGTQNVSSFNLGSALQTLPGSGFVVADVTGDGRDDIVKWADDPAQTILYVSNGDGTFTASSGFTEFFGNAARQLKSSNGLTDFLVGNFTGKGSADILRLKTQVSGSGEATTNQLYFKVDSTPPDQLISVTGPTGLTTALTFLPLSIAVEPAQGARYTSDRSAPGRANPNAAVYPNVDVTAPIYVVTKSETDIGVDIGSGPSKVATEYSYAGLKANLDGRGNLGFREVRRQSPGPNGAALSIVTQYLQDFPYTGSVKHSETRLGPLNDTAAQVLSNSDFWYCDKTADAGAEVLPSMTFTPGTPCPSTAKVVRPYLRQSVESGTDLTGNALPTVTTLNTFSNSIDPTQIAVSITGSVGGVSQTVTKTTTNTYYADNTSDDNWVLGRLQTAQQRNIVTDFLAQLGAPAAGSNPNAGAVRGAPAIAGSVSDLAFGSVPVGSSSTLSATLTNIGSAVLAITAPSAASVNGADFSFSASACTSSLASTASCTISVKFQPTAGAARSGSLSVVTSAGTLSGTLTGTGTVSSVSVTANNAAALSANKGGANADGSVTFTNSGDQAATLTLSGLSAPYSVSPTSCSVAASGGTCVVTVSMTTGGAFGSQGAQSLSAAGASNGTVSVPVSGTLNGSGVSVSSNGASALNAVKGAAAASGNVTFTNSGNQAATLTLSGLSAPYSVSPATCSAAAGGGTCVVTVSMTSGGSVGAQGAQTLTATGGTTGPVSAAVSGTLSGSAIAVSANSASALSASKGGANADGSVTFTNTGDQAATLTLSGLSAPYSVSPTSCSVAASGGTCVVTVSMTTGGAFGSQGAQSLSAAGASNGAVSAPVSGTLNGSGVSVSSNGAAALNAVKGAAAASGNVTFTNSGNQAATLTLSGLSAPYTVSPATCSVAAGGGTCVVTVSMTTGGSLGAQGAQTLTAAGGTTGPASAAVSGTINGSGVSVSSNGASALDAVKGAAAASGNVTFTNSGNQAAELTLSGLSAPYSVSPATCSAAAGGGTCVVTVTMTTGGALGSQGAQTLTATGGTTGPATAAVSGTLSGSAIAVTANNASALSASKGGANADGIVTFTNSGNQAATLTLSGLSAPYSVAPTTCSVAAGGGTCVATVTMTTGGAFGGQGAQTLTATGATTGAAAAPVSGTLNGSGVTVSSNGASALSAVKGAAAASGNVTFTNSGNQAATLTLSGLSAPYSVSPATCSAAAGGGTCVVTVTMSTGGAFGSQGAQTLTATGATTGAATAPVAGTISGSAVTLTANNAAALAADKAGANASGTVTFTNSGNQAATLTLSGLSAPYSVAPDTCSAAASGGTCVVTVTMTTGGTISSQGAQTLTAAGATSGNAAASVAGTLTGTVATLTSVAPDLGNAWYGAAAPSANVTLRNDGNVSMTLSGLSGLSSRFQLSANTCTGVAPAASCTMTIAMPTSTAASMPNAVTTAGATANASFTVSGAVNSAVSRWASTSLAFGNVTVGSSSTQNITVFNDGFGANINWAGVLSNLPTGLSANTSACASVPPGGNCSVGITFSPTAAQAYSGASIYPSNTSYTSNTLTISGTGALPVVSVSPTSLSFGSIRKDWQKSLTLTLANTGTGTANMTGFVGAYPDRPDMGAYFWSTTCGTTLGPGGSCTVEVGYYSGCTAGSVTGTLTTSGANFPSIVTQLSAGTQNGPCY